MAGKPVNVTIGATLAASVGATMRGAQAQLQRLGSTISTLNNHKISVDQFQKLRADADQLGRAFANAKRRADEMRTTYTALGPPTAAQSREMHKAEQATEKVRTALTRQRDALRELKASLVSSGTDMSNLSGESTRLGAQLDMLRQRTVALNRAREAQQGNRERRSQLVGQVMTTAMVGMTLAAPAKIAIGFEDQMLRVAAVSNATDTQLVALTEKARQMGRDTRYSASEAGEGMQYLAMAGFNAQQQMDAIGGVLNVAAAAGADLGRTSDIVSNALTGFGLQASQANRVGDVLTKTFTSSNTTLESLGETLKYVAPVATQAGASIELVAAMTGVMGDAGIQGSMAGTSLRSMFLRMIDPAKAGQKALDQMGITAEQMRELMSNGDLGGGAEQIKRMGISITDDKGNLRDWLDILQEVNVKMKNMTQQEKLAAAAAIAGKPGVSGFLAVLSSLDKDGGYIDAAVQNAIAQGASEEEIKILRERLEKSSKLQDRYYQNQLASEENFSQKVARRMESGTGGALRVLRSATEDLAISIGNVLAPAIKFGAEALTGVANKASALIQQFPVLSRIVFVGIGAFLTLKLAILTLGLAWTLLKAPFLSGNVFLQTVQARLGLLRAQTLATSAATSTLGTRWATFKSGAAGLSGMLRAVASGFLSMIPAIGATTAALLANPITWIVIGIGTAIAGLAAVIYKYWNPITAYLGGVWTGIKSAFEPVLAVFTPFEPLISAIGSAFSGLGGVLSSVIGWIAELIAPVQGSTEDMQRWAASGESLGQTLGTVFRVLLSPIILVVEAIGKLIEGINWLWENGSKIGDFASDMGSSVKGWFGFGDKGKEDVPPPEESKTGGWSWFGGSKKPAAPAGTVQTSSSTSASTSTASTAPKVGAVMPAESPAGTVATPASSSQPSRPTLATTPQNINQNNTFNTTVTVTAPPGTDYQALARLVEDKVKELLRRYNSDTAALYD